MGPEFASRVSVVRRAAMRRGRDCLWRADLPDDGPGSGGTETYKPLVFYTRTCDGLIEPSAPIGARPERQVEPNSGFVPT